MKTTNMIRINLLLIFTFFALFGVYYIFLPISKIVFLIKDQYILYIVNIILLGVFIYFKFKLKDLKIIDIIPNLNYISIKSSVGFFLIFQVVDYYYEDGFIGMISQWWSYWLFGVLAYFLTHNINLYKNMLYYKNYYESYK
jgi:hypothetical protein